MTKCRSILVVIGYQDDAGGLIEKAVVIARRWQARIELCLCDSEAAFELGHSYDREVVEAACEEVIERARAYLLKLKASALAPDLMIDIEPLCESPLYEAIGRKVLRSGPEIVIKGWPAGRGTRDPNDWQLIRTCPTTVMLTGHRMWRRPPRFAAAVDASEQEREGMPEAVLQAAQVLAAAWGAEVDVVCAEGPEMEPKSCAGKLRALCASRGIAAERTHLLHGIPEDSLPRFTARQDYDVLILGALAHQAERTQVGTLTSRLLNGATCDFVFVKPPGFRSPIEGQFADPRCTPSALAGATHTRRRDG